MSDLPTLAPAAPSAPVPVPPEAAAPGVSAVMAGWPGPALRASADGAVAAANPAARALLERGGDWTGMLARWLAAGGPASSPTVSVPLGTEVNAPVVEWTATTLPGGEVLLLGRDVTLERRLRQALTESRQRYKDLVEVSNDFAWETGPDGRFVFVSPHGAIGYMADDLVGRAPRDLVLPEFDDGEPLPFEAVRAVERAEIWLRAADGRPACLVSSALPLVGPAGEWLGARGSCRDITDARLRGMELAQVRLREKYLGFIVSSTRDDVDPSKTLEIAAGVAVNATGALGSTLFAQVGDGFAVAAGQEQAPDAVAALRGDLLARAAGSETPVSERADGWMLLAGRTLFRHEVNGAVLVWREAAEGAGDWSEDDVSMVRAIADHVGVAVAQARYQERLKTLSERDGLTGLYNRRTFMDLLEQRLGRKTGGNSALLYFDLDNFKAVNDLRGHTAGDDVLRAVGQLLQRIARPADLAGRLGGDEFSLWIERVDETQALGVADRLLREAAEFLRPLSASPDKPLGVSIGVAVHLGGTEERGQGLVDRGDHAMYAAKRLGKGHRFLAPPAGRDEGAA
ncbi:MAG TPA: diguanylate cyclase [Azospirillaceae bacterium]|nr:diguanylate cyclase [Azospirillaceae bacterium]